MHEMLFQTVPKPSRCNDVKSKLDDETYDALKVWAMYKGIESDSEAISIALREYFLGARGSIPVRQVSVSSSQSHLGTERASV